MNALPVEIWDPPLEVKHANTHLQPYICSVVRLGLELILQGKTGMLDGFLFPHTCDSIQNLASIVNDYLSLDKPCYFFYHPKAPYNESSRRYYYRQLGHLTAQLEKQLGPMDRSELKRRVGQGRQVGALFRRLYELRAKGELHISNAEFYQMIRRCEYLHPDDLIDELETFLATKKGVANGEPAVILSGVLPNPAEILGHLDHLGVRVANDDLLNGSRRLLVSPGDDDDPFEALTNGYFSMPPCTTKNSPVEERADYLLDMIEKSSARGVIFSIVKFCEPELFDVPQLLLELKKIKIPTLVLDVELHQGLSGQTATRVEAFVEMIG